jgi:hypothetical protein
MQIPDGTGGRGVAPRAFRSSRDLEDSRRDGTLTWMQVLQAHVDQVDNARSEADLSVALTELMVVSELWRNDLMKRKLATDEQHGTQSKEARWGKVLPRA